MQYPDGRVNFVDDLEGVLFDGEIYDLTDEGLTSLRNIDEWNGDEIALHFIYDVEGEGITVLYVTFAEVK